MTTIAFDGEILAADRLITGGNTQWEECKIWVHQWPKSKILSVIGCGGCLMDQGKWKRWFMKSNEGEDTNIEKPKFNESNGGVRFLEIRIDGDKTELFLWDEECEPLKMPFTLNAIGSGSLYAIGAIEAGASAVDAVRIAIKHDCNSGGDIDFIEIDKIVDFGVYTIVRENR